MPAGRPQEYNESYVTKAKEYLAKCIDDYKQEINTTKGSVQVANRLVVKFPSRGGMAVYLGVNRDTLYDWASKFPEFSDIMDLMMSLQEERLIDNGLSGSYNPTISKVILTKHGYREGIDNTTNDKDLPTPILANAIPSNDGNTKDSEAK